jgi:hypothetical protein
LNHFEVKGSTMQSRSFLSAEKKPTHQHENSAQLKNERTAQMLDIRQNQNAQRRLQESANGSQSAAQMRVMQAKMSVQKAVSDDALQAKLETTQRAGDDELLQGKFESKQRVQDDELLQGRFDATTQLKQIHETGSFGTLGLAPTGHTFSILDGELKKPNADLYSLAQDEKPVKTKSAALGALASTAAVVGSSVKAAVKKEGEADTGYTTDKANLDKSEVTTIDPFTHGQVQQYGDDDYLCLMYQHTHGFDGYVSGIEEGKVESPGKYAENFQQSMKNGTGAFLDGDQAPNDGHYSNQHEKTGTTNLLGLASGGKGKADAITKLAGEGARFQWVRANIGTITDSTKFDIGKVGGRNAVITFGNLWCTWKDWFDGRYDISEDEQRKILLDRARKRQLKTGKVVRIQFE